MWCRRSAPWRRNGVQGLRRASERASEREREREREREVLMVLVAVGWAMIDARQYFCVVARWRPVARCDSCTSRRADRSGAAASTSPTGTRTRQLGAW